MPFLHWEPISFIESQHSKLWISSSKIQIHQTRRSKLWIALHLVSYWNYEAIVLLRAHLLDLKLLLQVANFRLKFEPCFDTTCWVRSIESQRSKLWISSRKIQINQTCRSKLCIALHLVCYQYYGTIALLRAHQFDLKLLLQAADFCLKFNLVLIQLVGFMDLILIVLQAVNFFT